ncbi:MAG: signal recognition particle-docking protein FtsY [Anaeromusa sp.]|jgi:fused signal recognition particle receptor|uniref:signal recognition particle-docking protein FtsY n=1 Tax=Anaeromusa sp. TaxID=1872520 RepID=UPI002609D259|nr:signal recognition particle-docking protein FtsY [Anaeromusa sp.]MDD3158871.1 signal recognition particle-docking protein FtsY [Anaeromusa sp.]MEA4833652.1 signal recognition particle-docking protein FtsY [Anaeromusa sp.]
MGFFDRLKSGLEKTRKSFAEKIEQVIKGYADIDEEFLDDIEMALLTSDVGVTVTSRLMQDIRTGIKAKEINQPDDLRPFLAQRISSMLNEGTAAMQLPEKSVGVILVVGVNGVGKTTTIGKLGHFYAAQGKKVLLAAADTFRAAAIDQLEIWGQRTGCEVIKHAEGSDPAAVAFDALQAAKARNFDIVIIDTAGRLHNKGNLMEELRKIYRIIGREVEGAPHETLLVLDATTGQNALNQARVFGEVSDVTGVALTKLDGTAKGGVIVAVKSELGVPVKWIGVGEGMDDLRPFDAEEFAQALFAN